MNTQKYQFGNKIFKPGHEVSTIQDRPTEYNPTINDLADFTAGFETFRPDVYELKTSDGSRMQPLTGFGFADREALELAKQGKMTKSIALARLKNRLQSEYDEWGKVLPEFNRLPENVKLALVDTSYNGKGVIGTIKSSPNLINSIKDYNGSSIENIVKQMDHSKSAGGWLGVRSAARRAMALGEYNWKWNETDKHGRQINSTQYRGPEDWKASPYFNRYQSGGIVYTPFTPKKQKNDVDSDLFNSKPLIKENVSYPVIPVKTNIIKIIEPSIEQPIANEEENISIKGANNNNLNYINSKLKENGIPLIQRAAALATVVAESGANPLAVGDKGKAKGLWQWHPDRYKASGDLDSQISLMLSELADVKGGGWLGRKDYMDAFNTGDLYTAVDTLTRRYIRPANGLKETQKRYAIAQNIYNQLSKWM